MHLDVHHVKCEMRSGNKCDIWVYAFDLDLDTHTCECHGPSLDFVMAAVL